MSVTAVVASINRHETEISFNLWSDPWIGIVRIDGGIGRLSVRECLLRAHELRAFSDSSPLVIASLQRFLTAIVQDMTRPEDVSELADLLQRGRCDPVAIDTFGAEYGPRFDIFSAGMPFLQSADIGLTPDKTDRIKPVSYLFQEEPTATNINHFFHRFDADAQFSPATVALGLITVAPFASSGGAGIRPSINGVPPVYVLPIGATLFETLALSIVTPEYQPAIKATNDTPAWRAETVVGRGTEVSEVGYLESLTFPARRVRLFPERAGGYDSRTGEWSDVLVRKMVFDMGHARPKDAAAWFDPFAAYRMRAEGPVPIRPQSGKPLWREYSSLFHVAGTDSDADATSGKVRTPTVVQQVFKLQERGLTPEAPWRFRCIGIRTDMKAKIFEWIDEALDVPAGLLADPAGQDDVEAAIARAEEWASRIAGIHRAVYSGGRRQHDSERTRMLTDYWVQLAGEFRTFVLATENVSDRDAASERWTRTLFNIGGQVLEMATDEAGTRGDALRQRAEALSSYRIAQARKRKDWSG